MASFTRADYHLIFNFAREAFFHLSGDEERTAVLIMYKVEDCIGQRSDFPEVAREAYPRDSFSELDHG